MKQLISLAIRHIPRKHLQLSGHFIARGLSVFYLGNEVKCPVCLHEYRKFLPYGRKARENALCPNCLALERHRLLWLYLKQRTSLFNEKQRMLHIAPEYCFIERFESIETLDYITADLESPLAKVKMDIHQIPFDAHSFDCVLCNHVIEHVENDLLAITEILRVLKPGGWAIIQVPFFEPVPEKTFEDPAITSRSQRFKMYGQEDHLRLYGKDYKQRLETCGFRVKEENFTGSLPRETVAQNALLPETIYVCMKPPAQ
jgi:SAM-dependent methyltransferase